jgi:nucleoside-diphosphate-sugar epimerase/predicted dehydrogenase
MKQHILVTGAAGFIGKVVVAELLKAGYQVTAMVRPGTITSFTPHPKLSLLWADITDYATLAKGIKQIDVVVHLAANKYHPKLSYAVNLQGARNVVRLVEEGKVSTKRIINISSQSTKIRFRGVYGESKRQSDVIIEGSSANWTTLKPSLVYGTGEETLFQTIRKYVEKLPAVPVIGDGRWELYPIDVVDVAQAIIKCIERPKTIRKVYDLGAPTKITFDQLVRLIQKEVGIVKPIVHIPVLLGLPAVFLASKIIPNLPISVDNVLGSTQNTDCKPKLAIRDLGLTLLPIKDGVKKYLSNPTTVVKHIVMVGLGKMGIMHSTVLSVIPGAKIVAIVDQDASLGQTAKSMGIEAAFYPSLQEALAKHAVDAVFICTPTFAHREIIDLCRTKGIRFFVEKPVYVQHNDFNGTYSGSAAGYFWIYKREVEHTKKLLDARAIGKIERYTINLKHGEVFGPKKGWLFKKSLSGGGVLANPGPHAFSIIQFLIGRGRVSQSKLEYLYGNEVEDRATVNLVHSEGIQGKLQASWSVPKHPVMSIEYDIIGSNGTISFTSNVLTLQQGKKISQWKYWEIPYARSVYNLNPKSGGEAYYTEDLLFIQSLSKSGPRLVNNMLFAENVEGMIGEAYEKAR